MKEKSVTTGRHSRAPDHGNDASRTSPPKRRARPHARIKDEGRKATNNTVGERRQRGRKRLCAADRRSSAERDWECARVPEEGSRTTPKGRRASRCERTEGDPVEVTTPRIRVQRKGAATSHARIEEERRSGTDTTLDQRRR